MNPEKLLTHFDRLAEAPDAIPRLRRLILDLAVRGKLVEQDPKDEPASELLRRLQTEKDRLEELGEIKRVRVASIANNAFAANQAPRGWAYATLGRVSLKITDGTHKTPTYVDKGVPFVSVKDFSGGRLDFSNTKFITPEEHSALYRRCDPRRGDILLARIGTLGKAVLVDTDREFSLFVSVGLIRFPSEFIAPKYLRLVLNSPYVEEQFDKIKIGGGTHTNKLNLGDLHSVILPLPPLAEQRRIVARVDELMGLCDRLEAAQAEREQRRDQLAAGSLRRLNEPDADSKAFRAHACFHLSHMPRFTVRPDQVPALRQTILNLAVRGRLVPQDPSDEPAHAVLGSRQLHLDLADHPFPLPCGWAWSSFGGIGEVIGGGTPSKSEPSFWIGTVPWVSPKDMKVSIINDAQDHITNQAIENSSTRLVPTGALLMVVRGMILSHSFPTAITAVPVTINQDMKALVPFRSDFARILLLLTQGLRPNILALVQRSTHGTCKLLTADLFNLPIPIPPVSEQRRIVAKVDELMALCDRLESELSTVQTESRCLLESVLHEVLAPAIGEG